MSEPELFEDLLRWQAAEAQTAVFRSLLAVEVLSLTTEGISTRMLDAIRKPLLNLYEQTLEPGETWEADDV